MIWKSIALTKITDTNLCALTQVQLDPLDQLVLSETHKLTKLLNIEMVPRVGGTQSTR